MQLSATNLASSSPAWWQGWAPLIVLPALVVLLIPDTRPRWAVMWALAFSIYAGCKWLTWRRTPRSAPLLRHLGYLLAWPGMDAAAFLAPATAPPQPEAREWLFALTKLLAGAALLVAGIATASGSQPLAAGWAGMVGLVMFLHFGVFHVLSCLWRSQGAGATPLMDWPFASVSLAEFWGRRWNRAFRDLTHRFLFRPLAPRFGPRGAILVGFALSGVIHDALISWPAQAGYGGPTCFFLLQGFAILTERSKFGRRLGLARGWPGGWFTLLILAAPVGLLFHRPFVEDVIVPFLLALRPS